MKFRVGACALLVCLAGCSGDNPNAKLNGATAASAQVQMQGKQTALVSTARNPAKSIANAPDRGALIAYKNKGVASRTEGAYTWYPVAISEEHALKSIVTGEMVIPSPDGSNVKLRYERHEEQADGNWTWIGRVVGGDQKQEAILTFGQDAVFGSIPQPNGAAPLRLQSSSGALWAVATDRSKVVSPNTRDTDLMVPPALALRASLAKQQQSAVSQAAVTAGAAATPASTVDVAIGYTQGFAAAYGGASGAVTRLTYLIAVGNQAYSNSQITGALRLVYALQVTYADNTDNEVALGELTGNNGTAPVTVPAGLEPLRTARNTYGADLAVLVRDFQSPENKGCGIAWLNGADQTAINPAVDAAYGFAVVSDGSDSDGSKTYFCADETLVHELGHLMGSAHDRDNSKTSSGALQYGRYPYSFGMKTDASNGNFYTIMAYGSDNQNFYRTFSNPLVKSCGPANNLACGVADQTDNARSLNQTIPVVATFRSAVVPFTGTARNDVNGDGKSDLLWSNPSSSQFVYWLMNGSAISSTAAFLIAGNFKAIGTGDLDANGRVDVIWQNTAGQIYVWLGTTSNQYTTQFVLSLSTDWKLVGTGDVNGDGKSDLIWRNANSGLLVYWLMNGSTVTSTAAFGMASSFSVIGTGDIDGNGRVDILWRNAQGQIYAWLGDTNGQYSSQYMYTLSSDWRLVGTGDVNADGKADLLWSNPSASLFVYWLMNGNQISSTAAFVIASSFTAIDTGDYDGNGRVDIVWSNSVGHTYVWLGDTNNQYTTQYVYSLTGWTIPPG